MTPPPCRRMLRWGERVTTWLGDLVFRPGCVRCAAGPPMRAGGACADCWAAVRPAARRSWPAPAGGPGEIGWLEAALDYSGAARELLLLYKFGPDGGRPPLARPLAACLAAAARATGIQRDVDLVVPVPSHRQRVRERGFDAVRRLARLASRRLGLPPPVRPLARHGRQAPRSRSRNSGAPGFLLARRAEQMVRGKRVLLVDDVLTTGATIETCAALLGSAGAAEVRALILAHTPRRWGPPTEPRPVRL